MRQQICISQHCTRKCNAFTCTNDTQNTYPIEEMRLNCHTHFLGALLHLRDEERNRNRGQRQRCENWGAVWTHRGNFWHMPEVCWSLRLGTLAFSTASSIFSTIMESSTWSSHDVLLTELTGWLFNHEVISATFSALWGVKHQHYHKRLNYTCVYMCVYLFYPFWSNPGQMSSS